MSLICACNGSYYGGGFNPSPDARPDDGVLDFFIVQGVPAFHLARSSGITPRERRTCPKVITHVRGADRHRV